MEKIQRLLKDVKEFTAFSKLYQSKNGENFNMFRICGVNHYENTHSSIISEILNPKGSHDYGEKFLEAFIIILRQHHIIQDDFHFDFHHVHLITENATLSGRLDILIRNSKNQALLLENKIYAGDQFQQLERYYTFGKNTFGENFKLLYLTLEGSESSDTDVEKFPYAQLSYRLHICQWLERCIEIAARSPIVRETLIQYLNHIKSLTNTSTSVMRNEELIKTLSTPENIEAVFTVSNQFDTVRNHIINSVLLPQFQEISDELGIINLNDEGDYVNTSWAGFRFGIPSYKNYRIFMEFGRRGLGNLIIGFCPNNEDIDTTALPIIQQRVGKGNNRLAFTRFLAYENWDATAMKAIFSGEMKMVVKDQIQKLLDITKDIEHM